MLASAVNQGNRAYCWKITPTSGDGPVTGRPSTVIEPSDGCTNPPTAFRSEDFPQPDGPINEMKEPASIARSVRAKAMLWLPREPS